MHRTHGTVVSSTGSAYEVLTDGGERLVCKVKGNFRLRGIRSTNPVAVGDGVSIIEGEGETAFISEIDARRNYIVRRASNLSKQSHVLAANVDMLLLVITLSKPTTTTTFIDRVLASAEAYRVPATLVLNKADLLTPDERAAADALRSIYEAMDYGWLETSATEGTGLDALADAVKGKVALLAGHSGVGKSTLLNALIPDAQARTQAISEVHGTGMHTTTSSRLYALPAGGGLIDVPGVKGFGSFDMKPEEISHYFRDIFSLSADCRFANCTHTHEPACAVVAALESGQLAPSRYASYLSMLEDQDESKYREAF